MKLDDVIRELREVAAAPRKPGQTIAVTPAFVKQMADLLERVAVLTPGKATR